MNYKKNILDITDCVNSFINKNIKCAFLFFTDLYDEQKFKNELEKDPMKILYLKDMQEKIHPEKAILYYTYDYKKVLCDDFNKEIIVHDSEIILNLIKEYIYDYDLEEIFHEYLKYHRNNITDDKYIKFRD
jgi:hypothetical protein